MAYGKAATQVAILEAVMAHARAVQGLPCAMQAPRA